MRLAPTVVAAVGAAQDVLDQAKTAAAEVASSVAQGIAQKAGEKAAQADATAASATQAATDAHGVATSASTEASEAMSKASTADGRSIRAMQQIGTCRERLDAIEQALPQLATSEALAEALTSLATSDDLAQLRADLPSHADVVEIEARIAGIAQAELAHSDEIDAILDELSTFALKADLEPLARKSDLTPLAAKTDLEPLAAKDDLTPLAKKTDLDPMARKTDLDPYAKKTDLSPLAAKTDLAPLAAKTDLAPYAKTADLTPYARSADLAAYAKSSDLIPLAKNADLAAVQQQLPALATVAVVQTMISAAVAQLMGGEVDAAVDTIREIGEELKNNATVRASLINSLAGKQPLDATLTALAALQVVAGSVIYGTGADQFALAPSTAFGRSLWNAADDTTARTLLKAVGTATPQLRAEVINGVTTGTGVGSVVFPTPYSAPPIVFCAGLWAGTQLVACQSSNVTVNGADLAVRRSRGTLLLTAGPFEEAPAGTAFRVVVLGK